MSRSNPHAAATAPIVAQPMTVEIDGIALPGELDLPAGSQGLVIFAHGSASSRHSPRNRRIAGTLQRAGFGTFLFDLLTADEARSDARDGALVFNIPLLADRLRATTQWAHAELGDFRRPLGFFSASTGAAAALVVAAREHALVKAVVSCSGRPDFAGPDLARVQAPTLLVVGARDAASLELNRDAYDHLKCEKHLEIVPGAAQLFDAPDTLERVEQAASAWFGWYLRRTENEAGT